MGRSAKVISGLAMSTQAADAAASIESASAVQRLSWRTVVIHQNFSDRCRKIINAGTRYDDAIAASMSFLRDAQESPAVVLAELHVEMLALDLQFFRLDDVIHFPEAADSSASQLWNGRKIRTVNANFLAVLFIAL